MHVAERCIFFARIQIKGESSIRSESSESSVGSIKEEGK